MVDLPAGFRVAACGVFFWIVAGAAEPLVFPPSPRLALTAAELALQRTDPGFPARLAAAKQAADPLVATPIPLPHGVGGWFFNYACPVDGTPLRPVSPTDHVCPRCGVHYADERTLLAYRGIQHGEAESAALALGLAYAYAGDEAYAVQVKRILLAFADDYATYPARIDRWGRTGVFAPLGGRRRVQSLDEAGGAIPLAKAYDLTRSAAAWSDGERRHVEEDLLRATATTLRMAPMGRENRQAWYNAGLLAIGSALGDAALVDEALHGPSGFDNVLARGVGDDGMWWEGTMAYQTYALQPLLQTVDLARNLGIPLQDHPRLRALLRSPLRATYPDGTFPAVNDSDPSNIHLFDGSFAWAWAAYREPVFAQALARSDLARLAQLLGPAAVPAEPLEQATADLPGIGLLFLRVGRGADAVCATFHYGSPGGDATGHGHRDKLNLTLFAGGREWLADIGRIGYSHAEYKGWARRTIAHNTVTIGGADQAIDTGRLRWLESDDEHAACSGESTGAYPGITLRRHLLLTRELLIDVVDVEAPAGSVIDLAAHVAGAPLVAPDGLAGTAVASLGSDQGYQYLTAIRGFEPTASSAWTFPSAEEPGRGLRTVLAHQPGERIFAATGIGYRADQAAPCLLRRMTGTTARFACVYDLTRTGTHVLGIDAPTTGEPRVTVRTADGGTLSAAFTGSGLRWSRERR